MNKTLRFSLISMLMMLCGTVFAGSITFGDLNLENGVQYADPFDGGDFTVTFAGGGNDGKYYTTGTGIRVYGGGTMTIAAKSGNITSITVTYDGSNKPSDGTVVNVGTYNAETGEWTGDASSVVFTRPTGSGHWRVKSISVTASGAAVATPTFTPNGCTFVGRTSVEIACATEGATIYYSMNGEDPVAGSSPEYGRALPITETTTVKAIAVKGDATSAVASATFTQIPSYSTFASMSALESNAIFAYTGQAMIMAKPTAKYVYLYDGNDFSLIYDNSGEKTTDAEVGKYITPGWTGKVSIYRNLFELVPDDAIVVNDDPAQPVTYPAIALGTAKMNQVFTLKDVTYFSVDDKKNVSITVNNEDKDISEAQGVYGYNQFGITIPELETGKTYQIVGAIGQYNDKVQFWPIEITEQVEETPEPDPSFYIVGSMTNWAIDANYQMTLNEALVEQGIKEFSVTMTLKANDAFKAVSSTDGENMKSWFPGGEGNDYVISEDGTYTIYFRPNADGGDDWHYNVLYAAKNETPEPAQKASVTYALSTGDTFTSAQTIEVKNDGATVATITYGETGGADFKAAKSDGHIDGFTAFTEGNGTNGNKEGGTFYTIVPNYDGKIAVGVVLNAEKAFYVEEDGTALADYDGITVTEKYYGTYEFEVTANKSYKFYCAGSKLGFYGFNYEYVAAAPLNKYTATFDNAGGWEEVYAYAWSTTGEGDEAVTTKFLGDWPGTKIEAVEGVYTVTIEAKAAPDSIIFTAGANGPQTEDLAFEDGKAYNYVVPAQTATFNFADPNFRENIGETMTDTKGYIYNETFTVDGTTLQITAGSAPSRVYTDSNRGQCLVTYKEYTTLTFNAPEGKAITKIEFTAAGNSNINNFRASSGAIEGMVWTGNAAGVRFLQGGTSYLANAIVTLEAATEATAALPAIEYTECANIAAFNALEAGTYAKLTLTNAEVIGKSADGFTTVWIQDATGGAWIQYTSLNDQLQEGTKVNGTIFTIKRFTSGNPQLKEAEATINSKFISEAINAYTVVEGSIDEVNVAANLNKVVKISGATLTMTSTSVGKLTLGETSIDVNNGTATANQQLHKVADWEENKVLENVTITAILVAKSATANQLLPISIEQPVEEEKLYIIGNGTANAWAGTTEMTYKEETQAFEYIVESEGDIYIAFSDIEWTATNDGWDDFNANHRWAIDSGDKDATVGEALQLQKVNGTLKLAAGTYNVSVTKDMQCTITKTVPTGINAIAADRLNGVVYNLNGQKVMKAQKGLYIINGKKTMVK